MSEATEPLLTVDGERKQLILSPSVDVVGDVAIVVINRGRGRPRHEMPPKEKRSV